ncbi:MAG: hypothetical protein AB8B81_15455 [Halioglobus sp.]
MNKSLYWSLTLLSVCALALVLANIVLFGGNRELQQEATERQQKINAGVQINQLNNQMIQLIAQTAVNQQDEDLRSLLLGNGVTIKDNPQQPPAAPVAPTQGDSQ